MKTEDDLALTGNKMDKEKKSDRLLTQIEWIFNNLSNYIFWWATWKEPACE